MTTARREHFGELLEPGLRKIFYEVYDQIPSMISELYNVTTTGNPFETDLSIGTMGTFPKFTGQVQYDRMYEGYKKTYEFPEYAKGFPIERKLYDDDRYNEINKRPVGLAISAARRREVDGAFMFNNAFATTGTDQDGNTISTAGPDGVALCSASHPSKRPDGPSTRSNRGTLALSHSGLQTTKQNMRATVDDSNGKISVVPDTILAPVGLEETAWELITSEGRVNTTDNNPNIHQGRYKLIIWDYLTDTNNWFLLDSRYRKLFVTWFDRVALEFAMEEDFDSLVAKFRAYMRYNSGFADWIWIYGNEVTGA